MPGTAPCRTALEVAVEASTAPAVCPRQASTLREEMAVGGEGLLTTSGQIPMAAHNRPFLSPVPVRRLVV